MGNHLLLLAPDLQSAIVREDWHNETREMSVEDEVRSSG